MTVVEYACERYLLGLLLTFSSHYPPKPGMLPANSV